MLKWGLPGRGSNLLKSPRLLMPTTPPRGIGNSAKLYALNYLQLGISPLSASRGAALVWLSARLQAVMGSFGPQILAHALPTALVLFTCPLRSDLKRTPLAGRGRWAEVKYDHCQANSRRRGLKGVAAARGRRAAWSEQSFAFARVLAQSTNTIEEAGRALLSLHKVCSAPKVPVASSHQPLPLV